MYSNNEPSTWEAIPAAGEPATVAFANDEEHELSPVDVSEPQLRSDVAEQLNSGLLMSFLTDFRSAEHEQIRKQREEELAKTRKRVPRKPVLPEPEDVEPEVDYEESHPAPAADIPYHQVEPGQEAPAVEVPYHQPAAHEYWPPTPAPEQNAASQPVPPEEQRVRRLRLPFGIRQSPATT